MAEDNSWRRLIKLTLPIAMGFYAAGIAFGVLAMSANLPWWLAFLMSLLVYTGAAQYAAIPLFASSAGPLAITLSTFLISLRHFVYTLVIRKELPQKGFVRFYSGAALTDESFSLLLTQPKSSRKSMVVRINFLCHFYWVSASLIGIVLGEGLNNLIPHLDFALPCLFIILAYEQFSQNREIFPLFVAPIAFLIALNFLPQWLILSAILLSVLAILLKFLLSRAEVKNDSI